MQLVQILIALQFINNLHTNTHDVHIYLCLCADMYFVLYTLISQRRTGLYTNLTGTSVNSVSFSHYGLLETSKLFQQIVKICPWLVLRS